MKNKLKKGLMLLAMFCLTLGLAQAQNDKQPKPKMTPEQRADKRTQVMKDELQLNDAQTSQVRAVFLKHAEERDAHSEQAGASNKEMNNELKGILTPDQMNKYQQLQAERKEKAKEKRGMNNNAPDEK